MFVPGRVSEWVSECGREGEERWGGRRGASKQANRGIAGRGGGEIEKKELDQKSVFSWRSTLPSSSFEAWIAD